MRLVGNVADNVMGDESEDMEEEVEAEDDDERAAGGNDASLSNVLARIGTPEASRATSKRSPRIITKPRNKHKKTMKTPSEHNQPTCKAAFPADSQNATRNADLWRPEA